MSGMTTLSGSADAPPTPFGSAIVDQHAAVLASFGVVAALQARERTGTGTRVESNLLNAALDLQIEPFTYYMNNGPLWQRTDPPTGSRFHPAPYGVYRTQDGWIAISLTPTHKLATALDCPALDAFQHPRDNVLRRDEVNRLVHDALKTRSTEAWMRTFEQHDIWFAPVNDYEQVEADPQVAHNQMIMQFEHDEAGPVRLLAHPVRYDGAAPALRMHPPRQGQHTREVLAELGLLPDQIDDLIDRGIALTSRRSK
jgi:crotonobetainyl-CoA:carnitine CoA-transferase CaiB-like acyl-CoA transferase